MERWAILIQFGSSYEISDLGNLRSIDRIDAAGSKRKSQIIKPKIDKKYYRAGVRYDRKQKTVCIHILVAKMFVPNPNNYTLVNHLDGNTLNNAYWNLEWTTHLGNTIHAIRNRLTKKSNGIENTLTEKQVIEIFNNIEPATKICKKYNVCPLTIHQIRNGIKWGWLTNKVYKSKDGNRKYIQINEEKITHTELAKKIGANPATITYRLNQGWSIEKILSIKPKKKGVVRWVNINQKERIYK